MNSSDQNQLSESSSESQYRVRAIRQQDLFEVAGILADSFPLSPEFLRWLVPVVRVGIYEDLRSRMRSASPHYVCLVAVDGSKSSDSAEYLVGTVEVGLRHDAPWQPRSSGSLTVGSHQYPYLSNLAVREEYRGRGIAKKMLATCDRTVMDWGFREICLHVLETNQGARQLYLKSGYRLEQTQSSFTSFLFGQPRRMFLQKKLDRKLEN